MGHEEEEEEKKKVSGSSPGVMSPGRGELKLVPIGWLSRLPTEVTRAFCVIPSVSIESRLHLIFLLPDPVDAFSATRRRFSIS
ncbi:hypothetical protein WN55_04302 [Dufourea novaeangliae]|uniref:Uncharacterized protein n=1 Tax=Dufourea novaeangliae TaxID=178035 RepID=A0A154PNI0_DUFNO|nr:hypothetical protein WN55_04302 [Dufourea novaeangliae]